MFNNIYSNLKARTKSMISEASSLINSLSVDDLLSAPELKYKNLRKVYSSPDIFSIFLPIKETYEKDFNSSLDALKKNYSELLFINFSNYPLHAENLISYDLRGYSALPLKLSFSIIKKVRKFIRESSIYAPIDNKIEESSTSVFPVGIVFLCRENVQRVYTFVAELLFLDAVETFVSGNDPLPNIIQLLENLDLGMRFYSESQIRYLLYAQKLVYSELGISADKKKLKKIPFNKKIVLKKLAVTNFPVPLIAKEGLKEIRPVFEIIKNNKIVFSTLNRAKKAKEIDLKLIDKFGGESNFFLIEIVENVEITNDFTFRIKDFYAENDLIISKTIFKGMLNTSFLAVEATKDDQNEFYTFVMKITTVEKNSKFYEYKELSNISLSFEVLNSNSDNEFNWKYLLKNENTVETKESNLEEELDKCLVELSHK